MEPVKHWPISKQRQLCVTFLMQLQKH